MEEAQCKSGARCEMSGMVDKRLRLGLRRLGTDCCKGCCAAASHTHVPDVSDGTSNESWSDKELCITTIKINSYMYMSRLTLLRFFPFSFSSSFFLLLIYFLEFFFLQGNKQYAGSGDR